MTKTRIKMLAEKTEKYLRTPQGKLRWKTNATSGYTDIQNFVAAVMMGCRLANYENIAEVVDFLAKNAVKVIKRENK